MWYLNNLLFRIEFITLKTFQRVDWSIFYSLDIRCWVSLSHKSSQSHVFWRGWSLFCSLDISYCGKTEEPTHLVRVDKALAHMYGIQLNSKASSIWYWLHTLRARHHVSFEEVDQSFVAWILVVGEKLRSPYVSCMYTRY